MHGALQFAPEVLLEQRTRYADVVGNLFGLDPLARVLANEMPRAHHVRLASGWWRVDSSTLMPTGGTRMRCPGKRAPRSIRQQVRGGTAHFLGALDHRRQRNARQRTRERIVVDADDRHLFRHRDPGDQAGLQQVPRTRIGHGDHADGFRQRMQPADQLLDRVIPARRARRQPAVDRRIEPSARASRSNAARAAAPSGSPARSAGCTSRNARVPHRSGACTRATRASGCPSRYRGHRPDTGPDPRTTSRPRRPAAASRRARWRRRDRRSPR